MENFTPKIVNKDMPYIEMIIEGKYCKTCSKIMLPKIKRGLFPNWLHLDQEAQMKRAGFVYATDTLVDDKPICIECEKAGKADFLCALCNERKPSDKKQCSFGDPAEYLCSDCYETKPAKVWDEKTDELFDSHKYDFD